MSNQSSKGAKAKRGVFGQLSGTIEGFTITKEGVIRKKKKKQPKS